MDNSVLDRKLKSLIKVCMDSKNYKKLAVVGFVLISNALNKIGIKLCIRPREKTSDESIANYIKLINSVLTKNFNISLIDKELVYKIKIIEQQFIKRKGDVPFEYIKEIFGIYYDLRKLDIPNLHETFKDDYIPSLTNLGLYNFCSSGSTKGNKTQPEKLKSLLLYQIKEKELLIQKKMQKKFNRELFENALYLKKVKHSLKNQDNERIEIKGQLGNNLIYKKLLEEILGYLFLGVFILFFLVGLIIAIEAMMFPSLAVALSILLLISFAISALFFILYWNYFWKEGD